MAVKIVYAAWSRVGGVVRRRAAPLGLAERRPVGEPDRIGQMLAHGKLFVTARDGGKLVGVARSLTDFAFCCDPVRSRVVDKAYQKRGIGRALVDKTRDAVGPDRWCCSCRRGGDVDYPRIGMPKADVFIFTRRREPMPSIGKLEPANRADWEVLFRAYIAFYKRTLPPEMYDRAWREFQAGTRMHALGAKLDGRLVGHHAFLHRCQHHGAGTCATCRTCSRRRTCAGRRRARADRRGRRSGRAPGTAAGCTG